MAFILSSLLSSSNYALLLIFIGGVIGLFLLGKPVLCFWAIFFSVFLVGIFISHLPEITTIRWSITLLSLMLGFRTILEFFRPGKNLKSIRIKKLHILIFLFALVGIASSIANGISYEILLVSLKNNFQFISVFFALSLLPQFKENYLEKRIILYLLLIAIIQLPVSLYQRFYLGAYFETLGEPSSTLYDAVNGTFGNSLRGGASNILSMFLLFATGILFSFSKNNIVTWKKSILLSFILIIPILFNETKVSFVYIIILFLVLFKEELFKFGIKGFVIIGACFLIIMFLGYAYRIIYTKSDQEFKTYISQSIKYNFGTIGYGKYRLNRLTTLTFWIEERKNYGVTSLLIGHGFDSSNEGESSFLSEKGQMALCYPLYGIGLTTTSRLLWETGIFGVFLFFMVFLEAYRKIYLFIKNNRKSIDKFYLSILYSLQIGIVFCILECFISSGLRNQEVYNFLFNLILGMTLMMTNDDKGSRIKNQHNTLKPYVIS